MALKLDLLDATKANPNNTFDLPIRLDGEFAKYDKQIVCVCKYLNAETQEKCFIDDADGKKMISPVTLFRLHCKEIHGLTHTVDGQEVEYTADEISKIRKGDARCDGKFAGHIIDNIIQQVAAAVVTGSSLNDEEIKN